MSAPLARLWTIGNYKLCDVALSNEELAEGDQS
jgi:hypothetical protein